MHEVRPAQRGALASLLYGESAEGVAVPDAGLPADHLRVLRVEPAHHRQLPGERALMTTMACGVGWLHTDHDWVYQGRVVHCPGVWPHPLPEED